MSAHTCNKATQRNNLKLFWALCYRQPAAETQSLSTSLAESIKKNAKDTVALSDRHKMAFLHRHDSQRAIS